MEIIEETKIDTAHKVNNFIGESSTENTDKGKKNNNSWIVDTVATDHFPFCIIEDDWTG